MQKGLQEPAVLQWDRVIHKGARTQDGEPIGYIAADDSESLYGLASSFREYKIPKSRVVTFDGSTVYLDFDYGELGQFSIR